MTRAISFLLLVPMAVMGYRYLTKPAIPPYKPLPPIATVQRRSDLAALSKHLSTTIEGRNDFFHGKWHLEGDVILGVDLSKAYYVAIDPVNRTATLRVPEPHLIGHKVDHDRSFEISVEGGAFGLLSSKKSMRDEVWAAADLKIQRLGQVPENLNEAKDQIRAVLKDLFDGAGWSVTIEFPPPPES